MRQRHVLGHRHFLSASLDIEVARKTLLVEPAPQGVTQQLAALRKGQRHQGLQPGFIELWRHGQRPHSHDGRINPRGRIERSRRDVKQGFDAVTPLQHHGQTAKILAPGRKDFGRLTVMLQWRYSIEALFDVAPAAFDPPPRVDSAIVRMRPLAMPPQLDEARLQALVTLAFSQRRKLLRHTLGRWLDEQGFAGNFDVQRRAEEVPVAEYVALTQAVSSQR